MDKIAAMKGSERMARYYISDLHFGNKNIIACDHRPFSDVDEMDAEIIRRWNSTVTSRDDVVILGDLAFFSASYANEVLAKLNGHLFLIQGNHDHFVQKKDFLKERFGWIRPYAELSDNNRKVVLCHYPVFCYNGQYLFTRTGEPRTYMLYGHTHNTMDEVLVSRFIRQTADTVRYQKSLDRECAIPCQMINTFCGFSDYRPKTLDEWIKIDAARRAAMEL